VFVGVAVALTGVVSIVTRRTPAQPDAASGG